MNELPKVKLGTSVAFTRAMRKAELAIKQCGIVEQPTMPDMPVIERIGDRRWLAKERAYRLNFLIDGERLGVLVYMNKARMKHYSQETINRHVDKIAMAEAQEQAARPCDDERLREKLWPKRERRTAAEAEKT